MSTARNTYTVVSRHNDILWVASVDRFFSFTFVCHFCTKLPYLLNNPRLWKAAALSLSADFTIPCQFHDFQRNKLIDSDTFLSIHWKVFNITVNTKWKWRPANSSRHHFWIASSKSFKLKNHHFCLGEVWKVKPLFSVFSRPINGLPVVSSFSVRIRFKLWNVY